MEELKVMTSQQVADRWCVREDYIRRLLRLGELDGFRVGQSWRIPEKAVAAYEESHSNRKVKEARMEREMPRPRVFKIV